MNIAFIETFSETNPEQLIVEMEKLGMVITNTAKTDTDIILVAAFSKFNDAINAKKSFPNAKLVTYCWDYYKWAHEGRHHDNWGKYADFLRTCDLILVPSNGQKKRLKELLGLDSVVVRTSIPVYDLETRDDGFVLDPVRFYPEENRDWVINACKELDIPVDHSEHKYSLEEFRDKVASCRFMTCGYREASTGGLTLMEGLWNGKPSLVSNSDYMGAKDYLGDYGTYFQFDSYEDLKDKIKQMWYNPRKINVSEARQYMQQFTPKQMAKEICEHLKNLKKD